MFPPSDATPGAEPPGPGGPISANPSTFTVVEDRPCLQCGYSLQGLHSSGNCPECGTPVVNSLRGNLLTYASLDYLGWLECGALLVIVGLVTGLISKLALIVILIVLAFTRIGPRTGSFAELANQSISLIASGLCLLGWWLLSAPDPGLVGIDKALSARKLVRIVVAVGLVTSLFAMIVSLIQFIQPLGPPGAANPVYVAEIAAGFAGGIAWTVQFFASMKYLQWLAMRMPDRRLHDEAGRFMWMGPLIYIVGAACFWIGPLVATALYLVMLNQVRLNIGAIRREAQRSREAEFPRPEAHPDFADVALTTPPAGPPAGAHPSPPAP